MKHLKELIIEKLKINKDSKSNNILNYKSHELTPNEVIDIFKENNLGKNICKIYIIDHRGNKTLCYPQFKNQNIGIVKNESKQNWNIIISKRNNDGDITCWELIDNDFNGRSVKRIIFGTVWNNESFIEKYVAIKIEQDNNETIIYITNNRELNAIKAQESSDKTSADKNYFEPSNENNLINQIDKQYKADQIPEKEKYRGNHSKLFWCVWTTLAIYGEMRKEDILQKINNLAERDLVLTSYTTMFTEWKANNRIQLNKGLYKAIPYDQWNK